MMKIKSFIWDESDSTIGDLSSDYDTKCSIFGNHKIYLRTLCFRFHFKITQDKKNRRGFGELSSSFFHNSSHQNPMTTVGHSVVVSLFFLLFLDR
jgi:hypothetical protein